MFKLAPIGQDFSICLRCQCRLNLSKQAPRKQRRSLRNSSHPSSRTRPFTSDSKPSYDDTQNTHVNEDRLPLPFTKSEEYNAQSVTYRYPLLKPSLGVDSSSNHDNTQNTDLDEGHPSQPFIRYEEHDGKNVRYRPPPPKTPLGVDSMGEPAKVLVLRRPPQAARNVGVLFTEEPATPFPRTVDGSSQALLDGIDKERGLVDLDQACLNIDRIRDAFMESLQPAPKTLPVEKYDELLSKLLAGFEKKHLAAYWRRSGSETNADALNLHFPYSSTLFARSAWTPNITSLAQAKAPPLKVASDTETGSTFGRLSLQDRGKRWHGENILQRCWGLHREPVDTTGEMILRMQETHLQLILNHPNDPLKKLSKTYAVKFEASRKQKLMRVECDFTTSEDVMQMFIHILENIKTSVVSTGAVEAKADNPAVKKGLDSAYIKEVERLTNTVVVDKPIGQDHALKVTPREYTVFYLGPNEEDLEDARRLLSVELNANINKPPGRTLIEHPIPSTISVIPVEFGHGLPLMARSVQWARFGNPSTRQSETNIGTHHSPILNTPTPFSESAEFRNQVTAFLRGPEERSLGEKLRKNSYQHWENSLTRWSRVVLGQLAFPLQQARRMETKLKKTKPDMKSRSKIQDNFAQLQRAFATTVPGITRIVEASNVSMLPAEKLLIRMVPASSPNLPLTALDHVPQLEIQINLHAKEKATSFAAARLVLSHDELDLLLPSHSTDVRFVRRLNIYSNREEKDPSFVDFVNASNLDIWGSERLRTPNDLRVSIPTCLIPGVNETEPSSVDGLLPIDYKFAGLEHRSDLKLPLLGSSRPQYTTIEAGRLGGRREELAVSLGPDMNSAFRKDDEENLRVVNEQGARSLLEAASSMIAIVESDKQSPSPWTDSVKSGRESQQIL